MSEKKKPALLEEGVIRRFMSLANIPAANADAFLKEGGGQIPFDPRRKDQARVKTDKRLQETEEVDEDVKKESKEMDEDKEPVLESDQLREEGSEDEEDSDSDESDDAGDEPEADTGGDTDSAPDTGDDLEVGEVDGAGDDLDGGSDLGGDVAGLVDDATAQKVVEAVLSALGVQGDVSVSGGGDEGGDDLAPEAPVDDMGGAPDMGAGGGMPPGLSEDRLVEAVMAKVVARLVKENKNTKLKETVRERLKKKLTEKRAATNSKKLDEAEAPKAHPVGDAKPYAKTAKKEGIGAPYGKPGSEVKGKNGKIGSPYDTKAPESSKHAVKGSKK